MELLSQHTEGGRSLVKVLLTHLAAEFQTKPIDIYRRCLSVSLDLRTSLHAISIMDEENVRCFYREESEDSDPQFLSLEHPMTLRTIADVCDIRLVIKAAVKSKPSTILFDSGDDLWLREERQAMGETLPRAMVYVIMTQNKGSGQEVSLSYVRGPFDQDDCRHCMVSGHFTSDDGCELRALLRVVDPEHPPPPPQGLDLSSPWDHRRVVLDSPPLEEITGKRVIGVICKNKKLSAWKRHLQASKKVTKAQLFNPKSFETTLLFDFNKTSEDVVAVMPREQGGWYKLNQTWAQECVSRFKKKPTRAKRPKRDPVVPAELELVNAPEQQQQQQQQQEEDDEEGEGKQDEEAEEKRKEEEENHCCDCCEGSSAYHSNMSARGPQMLYKKPIDTVLLAKICGFYNEEMREALDRCHKLSLSSMDIESTTGSLRPGCEGRQGEDSRHPDITEQAVRDDDLVRCKIQRPLCIGHSGGNELLPSEGDLTTVKVFFRNRGSVQSMVDEYSRYLVCQRNELEERKRRLLSPMLRRLEAYRKAFFDHWQEDTDGAYEKRGIEMSWQKGLLGQLESNLLALCKKLVVFSFNGSRYDLPLLSASLLSSPSFVGQKKFVARSGSSVNNLSFDCGITFVDLCKMISPGVSLARFAESVGVETPKPLMPYGKLDERETFLDCAELPSDPDEYYSELTGTKPSQETVDAARSDFQARGFSTVRDYLEHYLKTDVHLLELSMHKFFDRLTEMTGLHPVSCSKFTLASYADLLGQRFLMLKKRVGCWTPNHARIFSVLRRAILGGLTMVIRSCSVVGETGLSPCNNHLKGDPVLAADMDDEEMAREHESPSVIKYYDVNSLYASAGEYINF